MASRQQPSDFAVEEILGEPFRAAIRASAGGGPAERPTGHALFTLRKRGISTAQAIGEIARRLRVPIAKLGTGGAKDPHGDTVQHLSVPLGGAVRGGGPQQLSHRGWRLERVGWIDEPFDSSAVAGHRYSVLMRRLDEASIDDIDRAFELLTCAPGRVRLVNYYGDRRFAGAALRREMLGPLLVRGEYENALRRLLTGIQQRDTPSMRRQRRDMAELWGRWADLAARLGNSPHRAAVTHLDANPKDFAGAFARLSLRTQVTAIESYQSMLFNAIAARVVTKACSGRGRGVVAGAAWGDMPFPEASAFPTSLLEAELPLLAPGAELEPWHRAETEAVLKDDEVTLDGLRLPGLEKPVFIPGSRRLIVEATDVELGAPTHDDTDPRAKALRRRITFTLPRGAYASVLLAALGE